MIRRYSLIGQAEVYYSVLPFMDHIIQFVLTENKYNSMDLWVKYIEELEKKGEFIKVLENDKTEKNIEIDEERFEISDLISKPEPNMNPKTVIANEIICRCLHKKVPA